MIPRKISAHIENWAGRFIRGPLLIEGAPATGKSFLVTESGKKFPQFIHINLSETYWQKFFLRQISPDEILSGLFFLTGKSPAVKRTLIFLHEIQDSPQAIKWIKEIHIRRPELFLIATSSCHSVSLKDWPDQKSSEPDWLFMYPCSFSEFLDALGDHSLINAYGEIPVPAPLHEKLMTKFHLYTLIGGMPEIMHKYLQDRHLSGLKPIYDRIMEHHLKKVESISRNKKNTDILKFTLQNAFPYAAMRIKFGKFSNSSYGSREMGESFRHLEQLRLLKLIYPVTNTVFPPTGDVSRSPRLHILDTGLVNYFSGIQKQLFHSNDINAIFGGQITRQVVGQELLSSDPFSDRIYFWIRKKLQSTADVDFLVPYNNMLIPVTVKPGEAGRLRSLHQFMDEVSHPFAVRLSDKALFIQETRTIRSKKFYLISLPYYLCGRISKHLEGFIKFVNAV